MAQQAAAIRQAATLLEKDGRMQEPAMSWLVQASVTLSAFEGMENVMRAAYLLAKQHPVVAEIFAAFPGATIADVRARTAVTEQEFCPDGETDSLLGDGDR